MDKKKDCKIPHYGSSLDFGSERIVVGAKQLRKAVLAGHARKVFLAQDADPAVTEPLEMLCSENHIPIIWVSSMHQLGQCCGIEVGAAAAAAVNV